MGNGKINGVNPKTVSDIKKNFVPYPKNPLLATFFINIGRADVLGSSVRNLYRFTKIYSGGEPELVDGDVFRTTVPLSLANGKFLSVFQAPKYGLDILLTGILKYGII